MNQKPFWRGLLRTVLTLALSLFLLSLLVFVIAHYAPGDPLRAYFGDRVEKMSPAEREWAEDKLGLNDPLPTQYARWFLGRGEARPRPARFDAVRHLAAKRAARRFRHLLQI